MTVLTTPANQFVNFENWCSYQRYRSSVHCTIINGTNIQTHQDLINNLIKYATWWNSLRTPKLVEKFVAISTFWKSCWRENTDNGILIRRWIEHGNKFTYMVSCAALCTLYNKKEEQLLQWPAGGRWHTATTRLASTSRNYRSLTVQWRLIHATMCHMQIDKIENPF